MVRMVQPRAARMNTNPKILRREMVFVLWWKICDMNPRCCYRPPGRQCRSKRARRACCRHFFLIEAASQPPNSATTSWNGTRTQFFAFEMENASAILTRAPEWP